MQPKRSPAQATRCAAPPPAVPHTLKHGISVLSQPGFKVRQPARDMRANCPGCTTRWGCPGRAEQSALGAKLWRPLLGSLECVALHARFPRALGVPAAYTSSNAHSTVVASHTCAARLAAARHGEHGRLLALGRVCSCWKATSSLPATWRADARPLPDPQPTAQSQVKGKLVCGFRWLEIHSTRCGCVVFPPELIISQLVIRPRCMCRTRGCREHPQLTSAFPNLPVSAQIEYAEILSCLPFAVQARERARNTARRRVDQIPSFSVCRTAGGVMSAWVD